MVARRLPIIGLKGIMYSGKSTAAKYMGERYGYERTRFAGPLKSMIAAFLRECGLDAKTIERMIEGDLKSVPSRYFGGRTPRYAMQTLGTEWGRDIMCVTLWIDAWTIKVDAMLSAGQLVVVDDCRFAEEADVIRARGGMVFEMKNRVLVASNDDAAKHASERMDFRTDGVIAHDGVHMATMEASVDCLMTGLERELAA